MAVIDGRASLLEECRLNPPDLQGHLAEQFAELLNEPGFNGAAAGWPAGKRTSNAAHWGNAKSGPCNYSQFQWMRSAVTVKNCVLCLERMAYWLGMRIDQMAKSCEDVGFYAAAPMAQKPCGSCGPADLVADTALFCWHFWRREVVAAIEDQPPLLLPHGLSTLHQ